MAADVVFQARSGESARLEDAWPALDLVKDELCRIRGCLDAISTTLAQAKQAN
jgi:hypothetical protein